MTGTPVGFATINKGQITSGALQDPDPAELGQLTPTVEQVLPTIEQLWRYADRDDAAGRRPGWLARLDVGLPEAGGGIEAVVADLTQVVIPNGSRISEPGWSGFITTGPTTSAVAAWLAAAAAGGQRYAVQAFNTLERVALDWVAQLCGIPAAWQGVFSSGGSTANLVALGAARQQAFERRGYGPGSTPRSRRITPSSGLPPCLGWAGPGPGTFAVTPGGGSMCRRCGPRWHKASVMA